MGAQVKKRLMKDLTMILENDIKWCDVELIKNNLKKWNVYIQGPPGTGYQDGVFHVFCDFEGGFYDPVIMM